MSALAKVLVAAITIGTRKSGYYFSFKYEYEKDPLKVTYPTWREVSSGLISLKMPTCVLFNENKEFHSFGYEAEYKYSKLAEDEDEKEWHFFNNFNTSFFNNEEQLSRAVNIYTTDGKSMFLIDVISAAIRFFTSHLLDAIENRATSIEKNIQWVLTVPSIWDAAAKQFMREAAKEAGICGDQLLIISESEAAFVYCMQEEIRMDKNNPSSVGFEAGTKYMVVIAEDIGIDIVVYEIQQKGILKKLSSACSCEWGGNNVDELFCSFLTDLFGNDVMKAFISEYEDCFHQLLNDFRNDKKRHIHPEQTSNITLILPVYLLETYREMNPGCNIKTRISLLPKYKNKLIFVGDKLRIDAQIVKAFFDESCSKIVYHIQELLLYPTLRDVSSILLVGSYAVSPMLQFALRQAFKNSQREVFVPQDAEFAASKGAVIYGHQQICSLISKTFIDIQ